MSPDEIRALEDRHASGVYQKRPVALVRGAGARLWDANGDEYLDLAAAHGALALGSCHPRVVAAVQAQAERLTLCPGAWYNDRRAELLARLGGLVPGLRRVFLCNSGTEAVEAALKFARLSTGRPGVVACMRGFHGRTLGALSATWEKKYREPFAPLVPGFTHVPYDNLEKLRAAVDDQTAAVIVEVVQGEGGVRPGSAEFLRGAQERCREAGAHLVVDEVQTGLGRTGRMLACEHHGLEPDLVTLAKALGGGLPAGAVLIGERVSDLPPGSHGSTFGGNPLVCAAALATLDVLTDEDLPRRAAELGSWLLARLGRIEAAGVREVRGLGLMIGLELKHKVAPVLQALLERRVVALPAGPNVLRLLPPLTVSRDELERGCAVIEDVLTGGGGE